MIRFFPSRKFFEGNFRIFCSWHNSLTCLSSNDVSSRVERCEKCFWQNSVFLFVSRLSSTNQSPLAVCKEQEASPPARSWIFLTSPAILQIPCWPNIFINFFYVVFTAQWRKTEKRIFSLYLWIINGCTLLELLTILDYILIEFRKRNSLRKTKPFWP